MYVFVDTCTSFLFPTVKTKNQNWLTVDEVIAEVRHHAFLKHNVHILLF